MELLEERTLLGGDGLDPNPYRAGVPYDDDGGDASAYAVSDKTLVQFVTMPYLQNVTPRSMVIMWEMSASVSATVEFGLTDAYGSSVPATSQSSGFSGTYIYKAELTGLSPESQYHYRVADDVGSPLTADRLFRTGSDAEIDFAFGAWADSQGTNRGTWTADPLQPTTAMMAHMAESGVAFGFGVGDMVSNDSDDANSYNHSYHDVRDYYLDRVGKYLGQTVPWFNAWGNHDSGNRNDVLRRFADMPSKDRPDYTPGFGSYHFTYANTLFIAIDYYDTGVITNGWLEDLLRSDLNRNARLTIVGVHVPPYSELRRDGDSSLRTNLVPLLEQYGVDLVISGHTHAYERGYRNGIYYVITGGGSWLSLDGELVWDWPHMTVGGYHNIEGTWARQSSRGVLGPARPIRAGLVNEYMRFEITDDHLEAEMHAFNADGSYIGVLDRFSFGDRFGVNDPPKFDLSSISKPAVTSWTVFEDSLSGGVTDPDPAEALVFSKISGPAWLDVAADGALSGLPGAADVGQNTFTVRVTDSGGLSDEATLQIHVEPGAAAVLSRYTFYNHSAFDKGPGRTDDHAIAPDKKALRPGDVATFAHYTSYDRGINGIMVDLAGATASLTANDFQFRVGNSLDPAGWAVAPAPKSYALRPGKGVWGSQRVTFVWEDGAIRDQWLQVTVLSTSATGLLEDDVFYFGNAVGESGNSATDAHVDIFDVLGPREHQRHFLNPAPLNFPYDYNRDARVNVFDMLVARNRHASVLDALPLWPYEPAVLITEVGTAYDDFVEIQNLDDMPVDTSGWFVVANDATDNGHPSDINAWHATLWNLSGVMDGGEVRYRTDKEEDAENYWGEQIFWRTPGNGWVMLVDDRGRVADFVVWGYGPNEVAELDITVGGFRLTVGDAWIGDAVVSSLKRLTNSLQRQGSSDHDDASDWAFTTPMSQSVRNENLTFPFPAGGAPGVETAKAARTAAVDSVLCRPTT